MELDFRVPTQQQVQRYWSPYSMNGGYVNQDAVGGHLLEYSSLSTILALAGEDFAVIASDTRLSEGFQIYSRDYPKTYQL